MRAIFMIPTSEPPTLPSPEKWSKDFNDFLKICLIKDPEKRPTATQLLKSHPFITKAKGKEVIAQLVKECMKEIDEYREQEAKEAEEKDGGEDGSATFGTGDISTLETSTMVGGPGASSTATGTIDRPTGTTALSAGTVDASKGTFVFSSGGTMVKHASDPTTSSGTTRISSGTTQFSGSSGQSGTMVVNSGTMDFKKKKLDTKSGSTGTSVFSGTGTMVAKGGGTNSGTTSSSSGSGSSPGEFMQYYRTGQALDVDQNSSLLDLRMSLISLNKAYEDEMTALEQFYSKRRQQLKEMITKKEKEGTGS